MSVYAPTRGVGSTVSAGRGAYPLYALGRVASCSTGPRGGVNPLHAGGGAKPVAPCPVLSMGNGSQAGGSANSPTRKKLMNPNSFFGEVGKWEEYHLLWNIDEMEWLDG